MPLLSSCFFPSEGGGRRHDRVRFPGLRIILTSRPRSAVAMGPVSPWGFRNRSQLRGSRGSAGARLTAFPHPVWDRIEWY